MNDNIVKSNGWEEWSRYVLKTLEAQANDIKGIRADVGKIMVEIAMLKVKSGIWGAVGGMIPVAVFIVMKIMK